MLIIEELINYSHSKRDAIILTSSITPVLRWRKQHEIFFFLLEYHIGLQLATVIVHGVAFTRTISKTVTNMKVYMLYNFHFVPNHKSESPSSPLFWQVNGQEQSSVICINVSK